MSVKGKEEKENEWYLCWMTVLVTGDHPRGGGTLQHTRDGAGPPPAVVTLVSPVVLELRLNGFT